MKVKVKYFGQLSDQTGVSLEWWEDQLDIIHLKNSINKKYSGLLKSNYVFAVNLELTNENKALEDGDEIAVMPPFAGG